MARHIVPTLHCDRCKGIVQVDDVKTTPKGWFQIVVGCETNSGKHNSGTLDFCSETCVEKWAKERRQVLSGDKIQCTYCEEEFSPKGFRTHEIACKREYEALTAP